MIKNTKSVPNELKEDITLDYILGQKPSAIRSITVETIMKGFYCCVEVAELSTSLVTRLWLLAERCLKKARRWQNEYCLTTIFVLIWFSYSFISHIPGNILLGFYGKEGKHPLQVLLNTFIDFLRQTAINWSLSLWIVFTKKNFGKMFYLLIALTDILIFIGYVKFVFYIYAPYFEEHEPLKPGPLRDNISKLVESAGFKMKNFFVGNLTQSSNDNFNAYFTETFFSCRIVLSKSFVDPKNEEKFSIKEICGVVAHELNHWRRHHVLIDYSFVFLGAFLENYLTLGLPSYFNVFYFRFPADKRPIIAAYTYAKTYGIFFYKFLFEMVTLEVSRQHELDSDNYASSRGLSEYLATALIKFYVADKDFPIYDTLYMIRYHTHPTLLIRVRNLRNKNTTIS